MNGVLERVFFFSPEIEKRCRVMRKFNKTLQGINHWECAKKTTLGNNRKTKKLKKRYENQNIGITTLGNNLKKLKN